IKYDGARSLERLGLFARQPSHRASGNSASDEFFQRAEFAVVMQPRHFSRIEDRRRIPQPKTATILRARRDPASVEEIGVGAQSLRVLVEHMTIAATCGQISAGRREPVVFE